MWFLIWILLEALAMNGNGELSQFRMRFRQSPELRRMPGETAYSYPVPAGPGRVYVYAYRLLGLPPDAPKVGLPMARFLIEYPGGRVLGLERLERAKLPVPATDGDTYGEVVLPEPFAHMPYDAYSEKERAFDGVYAAVLDAYLAGRPVSKEAARQVLDELPAFAKPPLVPLLKATNPDFFRYLESVAK